MKATQKISRHFECICIYNVIINTSSNLKEKVTRIKKKLSVPQSMPSLFRLRVLKLF